ncbi:MAG: isochorismatase family protein [Gammaproteobacteria bacterium]|nr:isochorismatase family protein [Gammaproteobacteria bacterium]MCH9743421.1 isochorismatase family protein [Gammaproteobacteria bacterium]
MSFDKSKIASFDVDAQKCFTPLCPEELPVPDAQNIVEPLNQQATLASLRIGCKDAHPSNAIWVADADHPQYSAIEGANVDIRWPRHAVPGSKGFELLDGLPQPSEYDYFAWKGVEPDMHPYGGCYHDLAEKQSTGVIEFLNVHNIEIVIIGGLTTDYCVKTTSLQLLKAGFKVYINLSACRGIHPDTIKSALELIQQKGALVFDDINTLKMELQPELSA